MGSACEVSLSPCKTPEVDTLGQVAAGQGVLLKQQRARRQNLKQAQDSGMTSILPPRGREKEEVVTSQGSRFVVQRPVLWPSSATTL